MLFSQVLVISVLTNVFFFPYNQLSFNRPRKVSCEQHELPLQITSQRLQNWVNLISNCGLVCWALWVNMIALLMDKWRRTSRDQLLSPIQFLSVVALALLLLLRPRASVPELAAGLLFSAASSVLNFCWTFQGGYYSTIYFVPSRNCPCLLVSLSFF